MEITVHTDVAAWTALASADGQQAGRLGFRIRSDKEGSQHWTLYTTVVEPAFEGLGIGSALVGDVMAHASEAGAQITATCWFIVGWLDRHPEYQHMIADDLR